MTEREKVTPVAQRSLHQVERGRQTKAEIRDEQRFTMNLRRLTQVLVVAAAFAIGVYVLVYLQTGAWQLLAYAGNILLAVTFLVPANRLARRKRFVASGHWIVVGLAFVYGGAELFLTNTTLYLAIGTVLLSWLARTLLLPRKWSGWLVTISLFGAFFWLVNRFEPLPRYDVTQSSVLRIFIPGITVFLVLVPLWQIYRTFRVGTIRTRLLIAFVGMVLLPAVIAGVTAGIVGVQSVQRRLFDQTKLVALLKESAINTWVSDLQSDLDDVLDLSTTLSAHAVLQPDDTTLHKEMHDYLRHRFQMHIDRTGLFEELFLLDLQGKALVSTAEIHEGTVHSSQPYFQEGLRDPYVQPLAYSLSLGRTVMTVARPITDQRGQVLGVLVGRVDMAQLNEILAEQTGLGKTSKIYLVDLNHVLLTESRFGEMGTYAHTYATDAAIKKHTNGTGIYDDYRGERVVGAYHWLPKLQVALLAEQDRAEVFGEMYAMVGVIGGVTVAAVLIAVVVSLFIARSIADPLANLAETATYIAAGDLERAVEVGREDEIGTLAQAFNQMTAQLRNLIGSLEQRVAARTRGLQAAADVARATTSVLDPDELLQQVVDLARERFALYYVGLFLLDEERRFAVLRAGTGEAGQQMLAQGHRLEMGGGSMIGQCVARGEARIALDVGAEAVRFDNPFLPHTRSELALPLRSRGQVIGAMTVQSVDEAAFDEEYIAVLQTMADQVAVAIDNARLFTEAQAALEEVEAAHQRYLGLAWAEYASARPVSGYEQVGAEMMPLGGEMLPEARQVVAERRPLVRGGDDRGDEEGMAGESALVVPILLRGQPIGALGFEGTEEGRRWSAGEVALAEAFAEQLALAADNLRLLDETQRRAARERLTGEVTTRVRETLDVETVLKTAAQEVRQALGLPEVVIRLGASPPSPRSGGDGRSGGGPARLDGEGRVA